MLSTHFCQYYNSSYFYKVFIYGHFVATKKKKLESFPAYLSSNDGLLETAGN